MNQTNNQDNMENKEAVVENNELAENKTNMQNPVKLGNAEEKEKMENAGNPIIIIIIFIGLVGAMFFFPDIYKSITQNIGSRAKFTSRGKKK